MAKRRVAPPGATTPSKAARAAQGNGKQRMTPQQALVARNRGLTTMLKDEREKRRQAAAVLDRTDISIRQLEGALSENTETLKLLGIDPSKVALPATKEQQAAAEKDAAPGEPGTPAPPAE